GKIQLGPDGKLDPAVATRQVLANSDPARIRARVFKSAMQTSGEQRKRIAALEAAVAAATAALERERETREKWYLDTSVVDERLELLLHEIARNIPHIAASSNVVCELECVTERIFWGGDAEAE